VTEEELKEFDEASSHPYECNCDLCKKWHELMGPEPENDQTRNQVQKGEVVKLISFGFNSHFAYLKIWTFQLRLFRYGIRFEHVPLRPRDTRSPQSTE
jgi:hypothetical protein